MLNKKAFTLIEIVVSIPILLILVITLLDFLRYNLNSQNRIKNDFMLNELAKEGIEVLTYMRDANYVKGGGTLYSADISTGDVGENKRYLLKYNDDRTWELQSLDLSEAEGIDDCIVYQTSEKSCAIYNVNGFFKQDKTTTFNSDAVTNFYRLITVKKVDDVHFLVTSEVAYKDSFFVKNKVKLVKEVWNIK